MAGNGAGEAARHVFVKGVRLGWTVDPAGPPVLESERSPWPLGCGPAVVGWVEQLHLSVDLLIAALQHPQMIRGGYAEGRSVFDLDAADITRVTAELIFDWGAEELHARQQEIVAAWSTDRRARDMWQGIARHVWVVFGLPGPVPAAPADLWCEGCGDAGYLVCQCGASAAGRRAA